MSVRWTRVYVRHLLQYFRRRAPDIHVLVLLACVSHLLLTVPLSFRSALYVDVTELQTNFASCQRMHFTHCSYLRVGSLGAWRHAHLLFGRGCRLRGALASGVQPEACQAQFAARARDEVFSVYRRCAGGTVDSLKHLRLGPQGGRRVYFRIAVGLRTAGRLGSVCRRRGAVSEGSYCPRRCVAQRCLAGACRMTATTACF